MLLRSTIYLRRDIPCGVQGFISYRAAFAAYRACFCKHIELRSSISSQNRTGCTVLFLCGSEEAFIHRMAIASVHRNSGTPCPPCAREGGSRSEARLTEGLLIVRIPTLQPLSLLRSQLPLHRGAMIARTLQGATSSAPHRNSGTRIRKEHCLHP